ncbi:MAG: Cob(I)alamin adenosyltransferase [Parcubacteria group bacterium GW2011_GWA2_43_17]|nr:MAG: Cob(I)alamin adenosyltransferase [Parcubacteria group bacterium GW2011_GWA2_43_17]KKT94118.1 MAG: Cob(I)alamin adenosyltransferase [Parcubacteria group bacterium GW2011_GWF2_45_11]OGY92442.1 MAG: hypothetical protein A2260_04165 [Candidatus Komeilibacteria bacterium RIFOXYA2_FULL_45_9]OGY94763.1 MAG: hypothetical protein A3J95_01240 [Candidatus Komeilibacteria bacterium RIFOXYC2_FULL_45_12]HAH04412.1 cob(I)yrinic acid a,c-diamide adenosyltransferase [Candidatus Komeilibacteria bacterium
MTDSNFGKIQVYTGHGKGKTTASLGLVIRALGRNKKVAIVYFDKGGRDYGERNILERLVGENFRYFVTGEERFNSQTKKFRFGVTAGDRQEAERGLRIVEEIFTEGLTDLLILDEINSTITLGMLEIERFLTLLDQKPKYLEIVLTGREAHPRILQRADLITEMKLVKHYFYQGTEAREGIEY